MRFPFLRSPKSDFIILELYNLATKSWSFVFRAFLICFEGITTIGETFFTFFFAIFGLTDFYIFFTKARVDFNFEMSDAILTENFGVAIF